MHKLQYSQMRPKLTCHAKQGSCLEQFASTSGGKLHFCLVYLLIIMFSVSGKLIMRTGLTRAGYVLNEAT